MSSTITLFLLILLPSLVSSNHHHHHHHHHHLADAVGKTCTSIARQDRFIPYDFCFTTLAKAKSADPREVADAAQGRAIEGIDNILNDILGREHRIRGDDAAAAIGSHSACRHSFELARSNLLDAVEEMYAGGAPKRYGLALDRLGEALDYLRSTPDKCEGQLVGLIKPLPAVTRQVETAIMIMVKVLKL